MFAMKRFALACLLSVLATGVSLSPAQAQVTTQKYASPTGSGNCTALSPCSLFTAMALQGGIVSCINGGFYEAIIQTPNSVTIDCPGAVLSSGSGANPMALIFSGSSQQVVILRNLTFDGAGQQGAPFIKVIGGTTLIIENCRFENIANRNAIAVQYLPNSAAAQLIIRDSVFLNNGIAPGSGGGLQVAPAAGGSASVKLERVSFEFNVTSMVLSGPVNATMIDSSVSSSQSNGILVGSGATLFIKDSTLEYNVGAAVSVASGGTLHLSNDDIRANQIGISNSGGQALSYRNNRITANGSTATLGTIQGGQ
jgi:hypothetical protein